MRISKATAMTVSDGSFDDEDLSYSEEDPNASKAMSVSGTDETEESETSIAIGKRESRTVWGVKILFVFVLFLSAAGALGVFFYIRGRESAEFEAQFSDDAIKVFAAVAATLEFTLSASDAFTASIISSAHTAGQEWPFVTVPDWAARAGKVRSLTGALFVNLYMWIEEEQRDEWETYTSYNNDWVMETVESQQADPSYEGNTSVAYYYESWDVIHGYDEYYKENPGVNGTNKTGPYLVWWQCVPVLAMDPVYNWDLLTEGETVGLTDCTNATEGTCNELSNMYDVMTKRHEVVIDAAYMILPENATQEEIEGQQYEGDWIANYLPPDENPEEPVTDIYYPILPTAIDTYNQNNPETFNPMDHDIKAILATTFYWRDMIRDILPLGSDGIIVVFENPCNPTFTYEINGPTVRFLGPGDHHDTSFDHLEQSSRLLDLTDYTIKGSSYTGIPLVTEDYACAKWNFRIFPSQTMKDNYTSDSAMIFTIAAAVVFVVTSIVFCIYDRSVERRQKVVLSTAEKTSAVVASLFPSGVRERLYESDQNVSKKMIAGSTPSMQVGTDSAPVAETFAEVTVCFIDITGFTAWSSARDPSNVFVLLETLYQMFDSIASRRRVFKVETIGDSYLCCTGLPHPQKHHASILVRFCAEVRNRMNVMGPDLDLQLGPGTSNLKLRLGLHSGPVTAGVLRGQKARFQLFGDTVNTAARLESTGIPGRIHISGKTADQLTREGKGHWVSERDEQQNLKGKGSFKTFFAEPQSSAGTESSLMLADKAPVLSEEQQQEAFQARIIDWMAVVLEGLLKEVVKHRRSRKVEKKLDLQGIRSSHGAQADGMVRNEVLDSIPLPREEAPKDLRRASTKKKVKAIEEVDLGANVLRQLRTYVAAIAAGYNANSFHNFEHACHVAMSSKKLMQRIITAGEEAANMDSGADDDMLHHSEGIRSDPLTQFAITFSALVHDLDHPGVANGQLVKEESPLAALYQNLSVAEQNSVNLALNLLNKDRFSDLLACICPDTDEYRRFRQVVINAVVTTDIFDKELKTAREQRWEKTYGSDARLDQELQTAVVDRKATIVIELVIQASDVSHTMQHWHIYQKWNHRLLLEQYAAFKAGRQEKNPLNGWAGGELWFFDNYIIPLASKMRDCKVFGVSCDEFLDYATDNRMEWASKGPDIVAKWAETIEEDYKQVSKPTIDMMDDTTETSFSGDPTADSIFTSEVWV